MEKTVNDQLQDLIKVYGVEHFLAACRVMVEKYGQLVMPESKVQVSVDLVPHLLEDIETTFDGITQNAFAVIGRLEKLQEAKAKGVPADYFKILSPEALDYSMRALQSAVSSQLEAGEKREAAYRDRSHYARLQPQLELDVKLTEAEAMSRVEGTGKDAYALAPDGKKMYLSNEAARDAYQLMASKDQRQRLAENQAELNAIEADVIKARDKWETAKEASDTIRATANLQASLFNFLASRW